MDDVINISGHRLGTAEIEDAMVSLAWASPLPHTSTVPLLTLELGWECAP
jgi:hypothetical protein